MGHPVAVTGYDHIVLRVRDLEAALGFYVGVLGLAVDRDRPDLGLTHLRCGRQMIDLVTLDGKLGRAGGAGPAAEGRNVDHVAFQVRPFDRDAIHAHLAAHGVPVTEEGERYGADGDGWSIYVRNPDGNTIELKGPS